MAKRGLTIAVEGCCHGELDKIYETMQQLERSQGKRINLLLCCGDFQAVRNLDDLECLACPPKYRQLNTFYKYYTGEAVAPYLTVFIGGNHEASNHLWELYYGGWAAPNIYFLGAAGVINFGGIRIGGLTGIYNASHYRQGHYERPPYSEQTMRSAYHIRQLEVYRLLQLQRPLDVFLSHDWPRGIAHYGDKRQLFRAKPFLQQEVESNSLGSPPAEELLKALRPAYWFSAHLHVKYAALYPHSNPSPQHQIQQQQPPSQQQQPQRQQLASEQLMQNGAAAGSLHPAATRFLALDKCLPNRRFLQVMDFPEAEGPLELQYDAEWLAVLRSTHHLLSLDRRPAPLPGMGGCRGGAPAAHAERVCGILAERGAAVPRNFQPTAKGYDAADPAMQRGRMPPSPVRSPQTVAFLEMLGLPYNLEPQAPWAVPATGVENPEEIDLDGAEDDEAQPASDNPEEIGLDEDGDDDAAPTYDGNMGNGGDGGEVQDPMFVSTEIHNFSAAAAVPQQVETERLTAALAAATEHDPTERAS